MKRPGDTGRPLVAITGQGGASRQPAARCFRDVLPLPIPPVLERHSYLSGRAKRRDRHRHLQSQQVQDGVRAINWLHDPVGEPCAVNDSPMHADILRRVEGLVSGQEPIPAGVADTRGALLEFLGGRSDYGAELLQ